MTSEGEELRLFRIAVPDSELADLRNGAQITRCTGSSLQSLMIQPFLVVSFLVVSALIGRRGTHG
jgi:hypothetical protein